MLSVVRRKAMSHGLIHGYGAFGIELHLPFYGAACLITFDFRSTESATAIADVDAVMSWRYLSEGVFTVSVGACALNNLPVRKNLQSNTGDRRAYRIFQNTS